MEKFVFPHIRQTRKPPLPRGASAYAMAKRAEYIEKDLAKAEYLYKKAIRSKDRQASAVKDLAGLLH